MNHISNILYDEKEKIFHLQGKDYSYIMQVCRDGYLAHLYWGKRLRSYHGSMNLRFADRAFSPNPDARDRAFSLDTLPQELPAFGNTDFRVPAIQLEWPDGSRITDFRYASHRIFEGKPGLDGLPASYVEDSSEAVTLEITLQDSLYPMFAVLSYTVFRDENVLARSVKISSHMVEEVTLLKIASMSVDFREDSWEMLHLSGAWGSERQIIKRPVEQGICQIESRRGASSHQHNPFIALTRKDTTESSGEVYGCNLVYSGNFLAQIEVDGFHNTRINMGINPFDFSWRLKPGETFQAPEAVMVYSSRGLGEMSRTYHRLYRRRLCRGLFRDQTRPILINNWEATYFNFDQEKIVGIARQASELGIELLVLDDGWFGKRNDDTSSLGDWSVNFSKLPGGLDGLARMVSQTGMQFGLWVEPEMVSPDSDLYRAHPDWCLHVPGRNRSESRNQLTLDFSRKDVCDYILDMMIRVLDSAPIRYIKWDMNRNMTEVGSALLPGRNQQEVSHRYILGLYQVLEVLVTRFPDVLFESCSGGGGRFDPGMLYYMPQTWTSDDTDAVERLKIQYGTSIIYPAVTMGSHVSAAPNHQIHRMTDLKIRGDAAMSGNFGYELDLTTMTPDESDQIREQIGMYKRIRGLIQFGDQYRLLNPFTDGRTAWMFVSEDKGEAHVFYFKMLGYAQEKFKILRLCGLEPDFLYETDDGAVYGGDELMYAGIPLPQLAGDFKSYTVGLRKIDPV